MKAGEKENGLAKLEVKSRIGMDEWWETGAAKTMKGKDEKWVLKMQERGKEDTLSGGGVGSVMQINREIGCSNV